jgi:hypothetical protein
MYSYCMRFFAQNLGQEHKSTKNIVENFAEFFQSHGKMKNRFKLFEKMLGPYHEKTLEAQELAQEAMTARSSRNDKIPLISDKADSLLSPLENIKIHLFVDIQNCGEDEVIEASSALLDIEHKLRSCYDNKEKLEVIANELNVLKALSDCIAEKLCLKAKSSILVVLAEAIFKEQSIYFPAESTLKERLENIVSFVIERESTVSAATKRDNL